jgi:protein-tyrosine phosphatase
MKPEDIIKNFRDVGISVNTVSDKKIFPEGILYRGGRLNNVFNHEEILKIPTILNLRRGKDEKRFNCQYIHVPAADKLENYDTNNGKIRKWINLVISEFINIDTSLPVYIHCTSGKDRTGVITAVILKAFNIPDDIIVKEYLLSDGVSGPRDILQALKGIGNVKQYLKGNTSQLLVKKISSVN